MDQSRELALAPEDSREPTGLGQGWGDAGWLRCPSFEGSQCPVVSGLLDSCWPSLCVVAGPPLASRLSEPQFPHQSKGRHCHSIVERTE